MTVELKLRAVGNSVGVILPKEALTHLKAAEGDTLFLTESPDGGFRVTAHDPAFAKQMASAEKIMRRYRNTLRELAK
ncbi:MAG TPA: AbrB/MazE/SpoVT family DNA-binding domain-containing protein [Candidatus Limnocylindria bacterium]|jgi:putative addiction module antidote|nr:AbrB/MazE/SpoVT family DNA-binding domain-containing protein [Candidatus Limnocylindria bacterium]